MSRQGAEGEALVGLGDVTQLGFERAEVDQMLG